MTSEKTNEQLSSLRIDPNKKFNDRPRRAWWKYVLFAALVVVIVVGFFWVREDISPALQVRVGTVTRVGGRESSAELVATGYVVAQRKAEVASEGTGRLVFLGFEEGDLVKAGQVIAQLDNDDTKAQLDLARANLDRALIDTLDAGRNFRRNRDLLNSGSITDVEMETAETRYQTALADLKAREASVRAAEVALENTFIRAPFDGTVLTKNADVGEIVAPFASSASSKGSVVTLADMSSLEVEADVSESNIYRVKLNQECDIVLDAYPQHRYKGYVKKIVPTADRARATVLTKVAFAERDERVLPEMSARVSFYGAEPEEGSEQALLLISRDAVTTREGKTVAFRVDGETASLVAVELGRDLGDQREVISGLSVGDKVILSPVSKLKTGAKVETVK